MLRLRALLVGLVVMVSFFGTTALTGEAAPPGTLTPTSAPAGLTGYANAQWYAVAGPNGSSMLMAVFDPAPLRPLRLPNDAILVLHGSHGFGTEYLDVAQQLAANTGYVAAAACWFSGNGMQNPTTPADRSDLPANSWIDCPQAPPFTNPNGTAMNGGGASAYAWPTIHALLAGLRTYAGGPKIGIWGHSRGAEVAAQMGSFGGIDAVALSSGVYRDLNTDGSQFQYLGYDYPPPFGISELQQAPVLVLHGMTDTVALQTYAKQYVGVLRLLGKPVQWCYYSPFGHDAVLHTAWDPASSTHLVFLDEMTRAAAFFHQAFTGNVTTGPACANGTEYLNNGTLQGTPPAP